MTLGSVRAAFYSVPPDRLDAFARHFEQGYLQPEGKKLGAAASQFFMATPDLLAERRTVAEDVLADRGGQMVAFHFFATSPRIARPQLPLTADLAGMRKLLSWTLTYDRGWVHGGATLERAEIPANAYKGIFLALAEIIDPVRAGFTTTWYVDKHMPELMETFGFAQALRFTGKTPSGRPTFLHIFFLDQEPGEAVADLRRRGPAWRIEEAEIRIEEQRRMLINSFYRSP